MVFTDGLVERKHEALDDGITRAAEVLVETRTLPLDAVADAVLRELAPAAGYDDDVAMVIYRHQQAPLRIETHAIADELASIRHRLADWLRASDVPDELIDDIVLVVNEDAPTASSTPTADTASEQRCSKSKRWTAKSAPASPTVVPGNRRRSIRATADVA